MIALAKDTPKTIRETWEVWEQICLINQNFKGNKSVLYSFGPMILLDPGSHAFNYPRSYGYRLMLKNLEEYIKGMSLPSWHQWISYETKFLNRDLITKLIIDSIEYSINLRERYGLYSKSEADAALSYFVKASKEIIDMTNHVMSLYEGEN